MDGDILVEDSDSSMRRRVHSTDCSRFYGLLSGQQAPQLFQKCSSSDDDIGDSRDEYESQEPCRLPLEEEDDDYNLNYCGIQGFTLRHPLEMIMGTLLYQDIETGSNHAEHGEASTMDDGDESDEGFEKAMN